MANEHTNPFTVFSPEGLPADQVVNTFVSVPGLEALQSSGHTFLIGARGSGKSMMLRYMEPDCQIIAKKATKGLTELPYYAAYLSIKQTDVNYPELARLDGKHSDNILNEHLLVVVVALKVLRRAIDNKHLAKLSAEDLISLHNTLGELFEVHGVSYSADMQHEPLERLEKAHGSLVELYFKTRDAMDGLILSEKPVTLGLRFFRFSTFLFPFFEAWRALPSMPSSGLFFLILDDCDKLNLTQTRIVNSWLGRRMAKFSIKISAELYEYKTFEAVGGERIQSIHDYQEINITDAYTSDYRNFYEDRVREIVNKRLQAAGIGGVSVANDVEKFFPQDHAQKVAIDKLRAEIASRWQEKGRGHRPRDDAYRYAGPEYFRSLAGKRKASKSYSYSGFGQLVNISSGAPRYFLEAAHKMFDRQVIAAGKFAKITRIDPAIQDLVVREQAEDLFQRELEKLALDGSNKSGAAFEARRLHNLIGCLGMLFSTILLNENASERRIFSFALSDFADDLVADVLRLGLKHAYLMRAVIGRKEGFGRTERYMLTRRFAPLFNLDPNGISAYKFLTNIELRQMMDRPDEYRRELRRRRGAKGENIQSVLDFDAERDA